MISWEGALCPTIPFSRMLKMLLSAFVGLIYFLENYFSMPPDVWHLSFLRTCYFGFVVMFLVVAIFFIFLFADPCW